MNKNRSHLYALILFSFVWLSANANENSINQLTQHSNLEWLKLDSDVGKVWMLDKQAGHPLHIRKKSQVIANTLYTKKILAIVTKRSSSYRTAINELLNTLNEARLDASLTVLDIGKQAQLGHVAARYAEKNKFDLIFAIGSVTACHFHNYYRYGLIPVVTSTNKDPVMLGQLADYETGSGTNIAYTSLNVPVDIQTKYLRDVMPALKTVGLLYSTQNNQTYLTEVKPIRTQLQSIGIKTIDIPIDPSKSVLNDLNIRIPSAIEKMRAHDSKLNNSLFWITASTDIFSEIKHINALAKNIPVMASITTVVKKGHDSAVLAIGIDRRNNARLAAEYAIDILSGKTNPGDMKLGIVMPPDIAINFQIARKNSLKIPFSFFESASQIYDYNGNQVRPLDSIGATGITVTSRKTTLRGPQ